MGKNILMIVAPKDFADPEYFIPRELLENTGAKITVASKGTDLALGARGGSVKPDTDISKVDMKDFDSIIISGGNGVPGTLWEDKELRALVTEAYQSGKLVAAICAAPVVLAKAGILNGKKATAYPSEEIIAEMKKHGADYVQEEVIVAGNVVTGREPDASRAFGLKLCELLA